MQAYSTIQGYPMTAFCKKHSTIILLSFLIGFLVLGWIIPAERLFLGITFLVFSFLIASLAIVEKHKEAYDQSKITRGRFFSNAALEITGTGLIMCAAGLLGRAAAQSAAQQIDNDLLKIIIGIAIGLLVGIGVGILAKLTWGRLLRIFPNS
jgi:hypothetical protein